MPRRSATNPLPAGGKQRDVQSSPLSKPGPKKRKRASDTDAVVPEERQYLKGMLFYYIPNDNIAPFRKNRIARAEKYGGRWVRDLNSATHVFVDGKLSWKDIAKAFASDADAGKRVIVKEVYPIDCIDHRCVLNPAQVRYEVKGYPYAARATGGSLGLEQHTTPGSAAASPQVTAPIQHDPRKWDYVPRRGTPSQGEEEPPGHVGTAAPSTEPARQPQQIPKGPENGGIDGPSPESQSLSPPVQLEDEFAQFVQLARQFKDVPLDEDEDDDASSAKGEPEDVVPDSDGGSDSGSDAGRSRKRRSGRKNIKWEDRFACNQAGGTAVGVDNPNARTIEVLQQMHDCYEKTNDHWRIVAYRKAINVLKRCERKIATAEEAVKLPGVGQRLADKIEEVVTTDKLTRLQYAQNDPNDKILALFMGVYGVGYAQAQKWASRGYQTLDDLRAATDLSRNQLVGLEHYDDLNSRIPRREMKALGDYVMETAAKIDPQAELLIGGSYRRGSETSGDIDFIVTKKGTSEAADLVPFLQELVETLTRNGFLTATLAALHSHRSGKEGAGSKWHGCCVLPRIAGSWNDNDEYRPIWRRIDFLLVPETEYGAALIYFTGDDIFNRSIRLLASKKGMRLNQRGLYRNVLRGSGRQKLTQGVLIEGHDEKKIFEALGVRWKPPEQRVYK